MIIFVYTCAEHPDDVLVVPSERPAGLHPPSEDVGKGAEAAAGAQPVAPDPSVSLGGVCFLSGARPGAQRVARGLTRRRQIHPKPHPVMGN